MNIIKNRVFAIIAAVILVFGSTLISVSRTLGEKCQSITDGFYTGVEYDGYTHKSIYSQLEARIDAAMGLITKCSSESALESEVSQLRDSRLRLMELIDSDSISDIYDGNRDLQAAFEDLVSAIEESGFVLDTASATYISTMENAQHVIDNSGYNESVREFRRSTLNVFPARILAFFAGVDTPELFS